MKKQIIIILLTGIALSMLNAQPQLDLQVFPEKLNKTPRELNGDEIIFSPGDTIRYNIQASNFGDEEMIEPVIVDPVPEGVDYIPFSVKGDEAIILFSINDGVDYQNWPPKYKALDANGKEIEKDASPDMVSHILF